MRAGSLPSLDDGSWHGENQTLPKNELSVNQLNQLVGFSAEHGFKQGFEWQARRGGRFVSNAQTAGKVTRQDYEINKKARNTKISMQ